MEIIYYYKKYQIIAHLRINNGKLSIVSFYLLFINILLYLKIHIYIQRGGIIWFSTKVRLDMNSFYSGWEAYMNQDSCMAITKCLISSAFPLLGRLKCQVINLILPSRYFSLRLGDQLNITHQARMFDRSAWGQLRRVLQSSQPKGMT